MTGGGGSIARTRISRAQRNMGGGGLVPCSVIRVREHAESSTLTALSGSRRWRRLRTANGCSAAARFRNVHGPASVAVCIASRTCRRGREESAGCLCAPRQRVCKYNLLTPLSPPPPSPAPAQDIDRSRFTSFAASCLEFEELSADAADGDENAASAFAGMSPPLPLANTPVPENAGRVRFSLAHAAICFHKSFIDELTRAVLPQVRAPLERASAWAAAVVTRAASFDSLDVRCDDIKVVLPRTRGGFTAAAIVSIDAVSAFNKLVERTESRLGGGTVIIVPTERIHFELGAFQVALTVGNADDSGLPSAGLRELTGRLTPVVDASEAAVWERATAAVRNGAVALSAAQVAVATPLARGTRLIAARGARGTLESPCGAAFRAAIAWSGESRAELLGPLEVGADAQEHLLLLAALRKDNFDEPPHLLRLGGGGGGAAVTRSDSAAAKASKAVISMLSSVSLLTPSLELVSKETRLMGDTAVPRPAADRRLVLLSNSLEEDEKHRSASLSSATMAPRDATAPSLVPVAPSAPDSGLFNMRALRALEPLLTAISAAVPRPPVKSGAASAGAPPSAMANAGSSSVALGAAGDADAAGPSPSSANSLALLRRAARAHASGALTIGNARVLLGGDSAAQMTDVNQILRAALLACGVSASLKAAAVAAECVTRGGDASVLPLHRLLAVAAELVDEEAVRSRAAAAALSDALATAVGSVLAPQGLPLPPAPVLSTVPLQHSAMLHVGGGYRRSYAERAAVPLWLKVMENQEAAETSVFSLVCLTLLLGCAIYFALMGGVTLPV